MLEELQSHSIDAEHVETIAGKYVHTKIDEWYITAHVRFAPWDAGLYAPRAHLSHFTIIISR